MAGPIGRSPPEPQPPPQPEPVPSGGYSGPYDPAGPDRDCVDFGSQREAQVFYGAAGGPGSAPHRLDADNDGIACESL